MTVTLALPDPISPSRTTGEVIPRMLLPTPLTDIDVPAATRSPQQANQWSTCEHDNMTFQF